MARSRINVTLETDSECDEAILVGDLREIFSDTNPLLRPRLAHLLCRLFSYNAHVISASKEQRTGITRVQADNLLDLINKHGDACAKTNEAMSPGVCLVPDDEETNKDLAYLALKRFLQSVTL